MFRKRRCRVPKRSCAIKNLKRDGDSFKSHCALALAGNGDVLCATKPGAFARISFRNRAGDLIRVDPAELGCDRKVPLTAIGIGHRRAAAIALGQALIDAVAVRLIGDDEDAAIGERGGGGQDSGRGDKANKGTHGGQDRAKQKMPDPITRKALKMINQGSET